MKIFVDHDVMNIGARHYRIVRKFGELTLFEHLAKEIKVWQIHRSANRLLIESSNFSLANHGQFAKLSPCQTFPLYSMYQFAIKLVSFSSTLSQFFVLQ